MGAPGTTAVSGARDRPSGGHAAACATASAVPVPALACTTSKPPMLRVTCRQLKRRAVGVLTFDYVTVALQEVNIAVSER